MNIYLSLGIIAVAGAIGAWEIIQKRRKKSMLAGEVSEARSDELNGMNKQTSIWPGKNIRDYIGNQTIVDWLKTHGPDPELWHSISVFTVPDLRNIELYAWLVDQPEFDAASAAFLFHSLEGWGMLGYVEGEAPYNEAWDPARFLTVKKIAERFARNEFSGPNYTLMRREDDGTPNDYEQMVRQSEQRFGKVLFKVPNQIFEYETRNRTNSKFHYSDYHYNPFGKDVGTIIQLTDDQLMDLVNRY